MIATSERRIVPTLAALAASMSEMARRKLARSASTGVATPLDESAATIAPRTSCEFCGEPMGPRTGKRFCQPKCRIAGWERAKLPAKFRRRQAHPRAARIEAAPPSD